MLAVTLRFIAGLAIGGAIAWRLAAPRRAGARLPVAKHGRTRSESRAERPAPQRIADNWPDQSEPVDGAIADTFPASDPPAFMQSVVVGPPPREETAAIARRQARKRADEDAFAE